MFKKIRIAAVLGLLLTGCATVNVPTIETVMRDTYEQACRDTVFATTEGLNAQGLNAFANPESCVEATKDFNPATVKSYRSDFELIVRDRPVRDAR